MRFDTWNIKSLYRAGLLVTVSKDLVGMQIIWESSATELSGEYTLFYRKGNENQELGMVPFTRH
jgi:hypothetical protein